MGPTLPLPRGGCVRSIPGRSRLCPRASRVGSALVGQTGDGQARGTKGVFGCTLPIVERGLPFVGKFTVSVLALSGANSSSERKVLAAPMARQKGGGFPRTDEQERDLWAPGSRAHPPACTSAHARGLRSVHRQVCRESGLPSVQMTLEPGQPSKASHCLPVGRWSSFSPSWCFRGLPGRPAPIAQLSAGLVRRAFHPSPSTVRSHRDEGLCCLTRCRGHSCCPRLCPVSTPSDVCAVPWEPPNGCGRDRSSSLARAA